MTVAAGVVMARGGSRGIPGKNLRMLAGKPLIWHTFEAAKDSGCFDRLIVSTDSCEIAEYARANGIEVPFLRPESLARDDSPGFDAFMHAVEWLADNGAYKPPVFMELLPTSPLRTAEDIINALALMDEHDADAVVSVAPVSQHPCWMKCLDSNFRVTPFLSGGLSTARRQDLPAVYALHGAIKAARTQVLVNRRTWYTDRTCGYVMPPERSIDIDTIFDFRVAGWLMADRFEENARRAV